MIPIIDTQISLYNFIKYRKIRIIFHLILNRQLFNQLDQYIFQL
jgi:hypothetical protein